MRFEWDEDKRRTNPRLKAMGDEDIDFSDLPEVPPEMFARALVRKGLQPVERKVQLTLRLDADVLTWFKSHGDRSRPNIK